MIMKYFIERKYILYNILMGNSILPSELSHKIRDIASELSNLYTYKFIDSDFCNSIELIYQNQLIPYKNSDLLNTASELGVVANVPKLKNNVCQSIINHYKKRLQMISYILATLEICETRAVKNKNDVTDLLRIYDILIQLKNFDEDINDEKLELINNEINYLLSNCKLPIYQYKEDISSPKILLTGKQIKSRLDAKKFTDTNTNTVTEETKSDINTDTNANTDTITEEAKKVKSKKKKQIKGGKWKKSIKKYIKTRSRK